MSLHKWFWDNFLWDHLCCHKLSGGPFMLIIIGPHAWVGQGPFMFYPDHLAMSMHKWSGRTNYDNISGPAGPSMLS